MLDTETDLTALSNKIVEILIYTQYQHWVDKQEFTAKEVSERESRARAYYRDFTKFHHLVDSQHAYILREIERAINGTDRN